MSLGQIRAEARAQGLTLRGVLHPSADDGAPPGCRTLLLLGPDEPWFWPIFRAAPECRDTRPHSLDRWSQRVIGALAQVWGGQAIFPSDGPPYPRFLHWAQASGRAWPSPIGPLVHDEAGLNLSYRGAVALDERLDLQDPPVTTPCTGCPRPCTSACPVGALREGATYDTTACQVHLRRPAGADCVTGGCLARRACPVSARLGRLPEQAAFHMAAFMKDLPQSTGDPQ